VVRLAHDEIKQVASAHRLPDRAVLRVDQVEVRVILHRPHERVGDADRYIEIGDRVLVRLAGDEFANIRVINT